MYSLLDSVVCGTKPCTLKKLKLVSRLGLVEFGALGFADIGGSEFSVYVAFADAEELRPGCVELG